jgi:hypothetical protein
MREIRPELLAELLSGYEKPSDLLGEGGLFQRLTKQMQGKRPPMNAAPVFDRSVQAARC